MERPDIEQIQERAEQATEGPWEYEPGDSRTGILATVIHGDVSYFFNGRDADFIANARQDVPALCRYALDLEAQVEQLREALEEDVKECAAWCDQDEGCAACYREATCKKRAALALTPAQAGERVRRPEITDDHLWVCDECGEQFGRADLEREDEAEWGHPCSQPGCERCESHRTEYVAVAQAGERVRKLRERAATVTGFCGVHREGDWDGTDVGVAVGELADALAALDAKEVRDGLAI